MSQSILQMSARHNAVHLGFLWFPSTLPQFVQPLLPLAGAAAPLPPRNTALQPEKHEFWCGKVQAWQLITWIAKSSMLGICVTFPKKFCHNVLALSCLLFWTFFFSRVIILQAQ